MEDFLIALMGGVGQAGLAYGDYYTQKGIRDRERNDRLSREKLEQGRYKEGRAAEAQRFAATLDMDKQRLAQDATQHRDTLNFQNRSLYEQGFDSFQDHDDRAGIIRPNARRDYAQERFGEAYGNAPEALDQVSPGLSGAFRTAAERVRSRRSGEAADIANAFKQPMRPGQEILDVPGRDIAVRRSFNPNDYFSAMLRASNSGQDDTFKIYNSLRQAGEAAARMIKPEPDNFAADMRPGVLEAKHRRFQAAQINAANSAIRNQVRTMQQAGLIPSGFAPQFYQMDPATGGIVETTTDPGHVSSDGPVPLTPGEDSAQTAAPSGPVNDIGARWNQTIQGMRPR
jgi:hypothetical protein